MSQPDDTVVFYDDFADHYHLIYEDWEGAISRQAEALDGIIQGRAPSSADQTSVLDCSCGIGTQAIGLALLGYRVHATDISPRAVERARGEAARLGAVVTFDVADMRSLGDRVTDSFDVVISCDNAVSHLMTDDDLRAAAHAMRERLRTGGLLLLNTRDYDQVIQKRPRATPVRTLGSAPDRRLVFQAWDWDEDGRSYRFDHFIMVETPDGWRTHHGTGQYRALLRDELESALSEAGFSLPVWHPRSETGMLEHVLTAIRA